MTTLKPVIFDVPLLGPIFAMILRWAMSSELRRRTFASRSWGEQSKTEGQASSPAGRGRGRSSGWGKVTRGGDRAASRARLLHGMIGKGNLSSA